VEQILTLKVVLLQYGNVCLGIGLSSGTVSAVRGGVCRHIEINLKEIKESKFCSYKIAEFGIGNAEVSCRPAAEVSCLVHF